MESFSTVQKRHKYRHRFTPIKKLSIQETELNFSFADWKPALIKRSPTSISLQKRPLIKDFYKQEQKKTIKIHKSFDNKKKNPLFEVNQMNDHIKKILIQHSENKKNLLSVNKRIKVLPDFSVNKSVRDQIFFTKDKAEENKNTPHFIEPKNQGKFPREVFSLLSKKTRFNSKVL